jgi:hypothetical protein
MINNSDDFEGEYYDTSLDAFKTFEDYLDSHITAEDLFYLEDRELARQLKEQGYHTKTEIMDRETFEQKKKAIEEARNNQNKDKTKVLASTAIVNKEKLKQCKFLQALAEREKKVLDGLLLTIIFLRHESKDSEISGYIDYAHRLKTEDFRPYFEGKKKLLPKPTDLSFYNWKTNECFSNDSPNFKVDASNQQGLVFRNKRDRKTIHVDPKKKPEENMSRIEIESLDYTQVVLYDHYTRKKN